MIVFSMSFLIFIIQIYFTYISSTLFLSKFSLRQSFLQRIFLIKLIFFEKFYCLLSRFFYFLNYFGILFVMRVIQYFLSIKFFQGFISCFLSLFKSFLLKLNFISLIHSCSIYNRLLLFFNFLFLFF